MFRPIIVLALAVLAPALAILPGVPLGAAPGLTWTLLQPPTSPSARTGAAMAYDADRHNVVLFGNSGQGTDTWIWDGNTWTLLHPAISPPGSSHPVLADDEAHHNVVFYAGDAPGQQDSTWGWDGTNWTDLQPPTSPPPRRGPALAYDAARGVIVLFGGCCDSTGLALKDTWTWDGTTWTQQHVPIAPPERVDAALVYDPVHHNVVLFGGAPASRTFGYTDTWTWDGTSWSERESNPTPPFPFGYPLPATAVPAASPFSGSEPPARIDPNLAYDPLVPGVMLYGGYLGGNPADSWVWDGSAWSQLQPATMPQSRSFAAMVYDAHNQQLVLFGGDGMDAMHPSRAVRSPIRGSLDRRSKRRLFPVTTDTSLKRASGWTTTLSGTTSSIAAASPPSDTRSAEPSSSRDLRSSSSSGELYRLTRLATLDC